MFSLSLRPGLKSTLLSEVLLIVSYLTNWSKLVPDYTGQTEQCGQWIYTKGKFTKTYPSCFCFSCGQRHCLSLFQAIFSRMPTWRTALLGGKMQIVSTSKATDIFAYRHVSNCCSNKLPQLSGLFIILHPPLRVCGKTYSLAFSGG